MENTQLITLITGFAAFITPRILAFVPGGPKMKRKVGSLISALVGLIVAAVEANVFDDPQLSIGTLAAFMLGGVGTKGGSQSMYDGYWKDKLNPTPDTPDVPKLEQGGVISKPQLVGGPEGREEAVLGPHHAASKAFTERLVPEPIDAQPKWGPVSGDAVDALDAISEDEMHEDDWFASLSASEKDD